jgi:hypothetical protein
MRASDSLERRGITYTGHAPVHLTRHPQTHLYTSCSSPIDADTETDTKRLSQRPLRLRPG